MEQVKKPGIIDIHAHFTTPEYLEMMERHGASLEDGFPLPEWNVENHLSFMKQFGIRWTLLSLSTPHPYFEGYEDESVAMCRQLNEKMSAVKKKYPDQFGFQATLPLPNIDAAVDEAVYALDVLHADGVKLASNSRGLYLGDQELAPLMEALDKRHAICNIHPHRPEPIKEGVFSAGPVPLFEFIADTTRAVLNLIGNGVILQYPSITWIVPHCGSFLPNIYDRFIGMSKMLVPIGMMHDVDVKESIRNLYFDIAGNPAPYCLDWLLTITDPSHIMYGSDYPFTPANQTEGNLRKLYTMLDREDLQNIKNLILYENAEKLFSHKE